MQTIKLSTSQRGEMANITAQVQRLVRESGVRRGLCCVHAPHTTAGIVVQEGYDPDVVRDILVALDRLAPRMGDYKHAEGNSDSHLKALLCGSSQTLPIEFGELQLGRWQQVFFCEFDGPRQRTAWVQIIAATD
jgi:secondary thiamine-phosphate synthase enzyme